MRRLGSLGLDVEIRTFPEGTRTAQDAANAVGCDVTQIVKSLVFLVDGAPVMALVAGSNRLDERRLAAALGGTEVARPDAQVVRAATGYPIGVCRRSGTARPCGPSSTRTFCASPTCGRRRGRHETCSPSLRTTSSA